MKKLMTFAAASLLLATSAMSAVQAQERSSLKMSAVGAEERSRVAFNVDTRGIQQEARKLESSLKRSPELREKLAEAMDDKNTRQVQEILVEAGVNQSLLSSDSIEMLASGICIGWTTPWGCVGIYIELDRHAGF